MPTPIYKYGYILLNLYFAVFSIKDSDLGRTSLNILTLIESDAPWYVDIEEMHLSVLGYNISLSVKAEASVIDLIRIGDLLWE